MKQVSGPGPLAMALGMMSSCFKSHLSSSYDSSNGSHNANGRTCGCCILQLRVKHLPVMSRDCPYVGKGQSVEKKVAVGSQKSHLLPSQDAERMHRLAAAHNAQPLPCCVWYRQSGQRQSRSVAASAHNHQVIPADGPIKRNDHQTVQVGSKAALPSPLVLDEPDLATRGVISFPFGASSGARP